MSCSTSRNKPYFFFTWSKLFGPSDSSCLLVLFHLDVAQKEESRQKYACAVEHHNLTLMVTNYCVLSISQTKVLWYYREKAVCNYYFFGAIQVENVISQIPVNWNTIKCITVSVCNTSYVQGWLKIREFLKSLSPYMDWYSFWPQKILKNVFWKINFFLGVPHLPPNTQDPVYTRKSIFWKVSFSAWNHIPFGVRNSIFHNNFKSKWGNVSVWATARICCDLVSWQRLPLLMMQQNWLPVPGQEVTQGSTSGSLKELVDFVLFLLTMS